MLIEEDIDLVNDQDSIDTVFTLEEFVEALEVFQIAGAEGFIEKYFLGDFFEIVFGAFVED